MVLFGFCLAVMGNEVDTLVEWVATRLSARLKHCRRALAKQRRGTADESSSSSSEHTIHTKMVAALIVLHSGLALGGGLAYLHTGYVRREGEAWSYGHCYYFAFTSFSTIGFGDFALGPLNGSLEEMILLLLQAPVVFFGLAAFNSFASVCTDWATAVTLGAYAKLSRTCPSADRVSPFAKPKLDDEQARAIAALAVAEDVKKPSPTAWGAPKESEEEIVTPVEAALATASSAARSGAYGAARLCLRVVGVILVSYAVMLFGGLLLYAAEFENEIQVACAAQAEENLRRTGMRLPARIDGHGVCSAY